MEKLLAPNPFSCDLCGVTFSRRSSMVQHKRRHSGEKPHHCEICLKSFTRLYTLQKHRCSRHKGEKPYSCDLCGRNFSRSSTLIEHKRTHAGEKPFRCDICQEYFSRRSTLHQHQRTHSGEKPYICDICGKCFTRRYTLQKHAKDHNSDILYTCDVCGQKFTRPYALQKHLKYHSGEKQYTCDVCGENFSRRSNLHVHKRTHTGEKPFRCTICGKLFSRRSNLRVHEQSHSGIKQYKCDLCGKRFVRNSTLAKHQQGHLSKQKDSSQEQRPITDVGITTSNNANSNKMVDSLCHTYGLDENKGYVSQQNKNHNYRSDCSINTPGSKPYKAGSNENNYYNNINASINSALQCKTTGPCLPIDQRLKPLRTHCKKPSSECNHVETLSISIPQPGFPSQQLFSNSSMPSKPHLSTSMTPRKWLEPPTVIVASSENPNEKLASTNCLPTPISQWQRNIPTSLVTTQLCNPLTVMQSSSVMET